MTNMFPREDVLNDLDVLLVLYPGEDDSPMVNAALLITDADAALVADLPPDVEEEHAGPMPVVEVCCVTSGSFFDVIRCGDGLMAFPTAPAPVAEDGGLVGHVGVDSGMVWLGDPYYLAGEEGDLVDAILMGRPTASPRRVVTSAGSRYPPPTATVLSPPTRPSWPSISPVTPPSRTWPT